MQSVRYRSPSVAMVDIHSTALHYKELSAVQCTTQCTACSIMHWYALNSPRMQLTLLWPTAIHCTVLSQHNLAANCNALHCTALHCTVLLSVHCTFPALYCRKLHFTTTHFTFPTIHLHYTALHWTAENCVLSIVQCNFYRMLLSCQKIKGYPIIEHTWCFINPVLCTVAHDSSGVLNIIVKCCC